MKNIDKFIQFLFERIDDKTISVSKKMKYGHRYYHIYLNLEGEEDNKISNKYGFQLTSNVTIIIDNRNNCIEINALEDIFIESEELVKKWSNIFESHINGSLEEKIQKTIDITLSNVKDKSLLRDYQMEKIFKKDDSL